MVLTSDRLSLEMIVEFDVRIECGSAVGARHKSFARMRSHVFDHFELFIELLFAVQPSALHGIISIALLVRFNLVCTMAAHMIEIVLNEFESEGTVLPLAQIFGVGVAYQIASS